MDEKLIRDCLRMLRDREKVYREEAEKYCCKANMKDGFDHAFISTTVYGNAAAMLEYAINGDAEGLVQFDYFREEDAE